MNQSIFVERLANGLVLLAEPMPWLESAAFALLLPAGCSRDPVDRIGLANLTSEMVQRGAGDRDSRQVLEDLERLGAETSSSVSNAHTSFGGALLADRLPEVLAIYADILRRPHLADDQFEDARQVCLQDVRAVEDDLAQKVMLELRRCHYGDPYGRSYMGSEESVLALSLEDVQRFHDEFYHPQGAILAVAGNIEWRALLETVEQLFGNWEPRSAPPLAETPPDARRRHLEHGSSQTHIGVAYASVPYAHPDYFQARGAVGVLSDGMSSRLFTEVRENRGLCYSVYASANSHRDRGSVLCYAGTTAERAQETLDVLLAELERLAAGIEPDELSRLKTRVKSALVMQQESSSSRSASLALDWHHLERVRTLDELNAIIQGLTVDSINGYLAANPPRDFTIVTLGPEPLETPHGVS